MQTLRWARDREERSRKERGEPGPTRRGGKAAVRRSPPTPAIDPRRYGGGLGLRRERKAGACPVRRLAGGSNGSGPLPETACRPGLAHPARRESERKVYHI